jgi:hypothetical protein
MDIDGTSGMDIDGTSDYQDDRIHESGEMQIDGETKSGAYTFPFTSNYSVLTTTPWSFGTATNDSASSDSDMQAVSSVGGSSVPTSTWVPPLLPDNIFVFEAPPIAPSRTDRSTAARRRRARANR